MNYKLDGIPISNYGAKPVRTNQTFALHGMLDLPKRLSPTEYNWGTSIEPFVDAEDIELDGRTINLQVAIKKNQLQYFLDACIDCRELEVFDERIGGRNLALNSNFNTTDAGSITRLGQYTYSDINGVRRYEAVGKNGTMVRFIEFNIPDLDVGAYTMTIKCHPENRPVNLIATSSTANGLTRTSIPITDDFVKYTIHFNKIVDSNTPLRLLFYQHRESTTSDEPAGILWIDWYKIEKGNKATDWTPAPEDIFFPLPVLCRDEIKVNYVDDYAIVSVPFWQYQVTYNPVTILPSNTGEVRIDGYDLAKDFGIYIARSSDLDSVAKRIEVQTTEMYSRTNFRATRSIDINCTIKVFNTTDLFYKMNEFQAMLMKPGMREFKIRDNNYYVYFKDGMRVEVVANNIAKFNLKATVV